MKALLQNGEIELLQTTNPVYILNGTGRFYDTEHKVMKGLPELLHCYKGILNNKTELVYITNNLVSLSVYLSQVNDKLFFEITNKLYAAIKNINSNAFLNWQHIDLSPERIFIQPETNSVYLIYLPIEGYYLPQRSMEKEIVQLIASLTLKTQNSDSENMSNLRSLVDDENKFISYLASAGKMKIQAKPKNLSLYDKENNYELKINKPKFVIGKKAGSVDGLIKYSQYVGRIHCQIITQNNDYYIYDLDSTNGTYLNDEELVPNKGYKLNDNDKLEIADVIFEVKIGT